MMVCKLHLGRELLPFQLLSDHTATWALLIGMPLPALTHVFLLTLYWLLLNGFAFKQASKQAKTCCLKKKTNPLPQSAHVSLCIGQLFTTSSPMAFLQTSCLLPSSASHCSPSDAPSYSLSVPQAVQSQLSSSFLTNSWDAIFLSESSVYTPFFLLWFSELTTEIDLMGSLQCIVNDVLNAISLSAVGKFNSAACNIHRQRACSICRASQCDPAHQKEAIQFQWKIMISHFF